METHGTTTRPDPPWQLGVAKRKRAAATRHRVLAAQLDDEATSLEAEAAEAERLEP